MPTPSPSTTDWIPLWRVAAGDTAPLTVVPVGASLEWDYSPTLLPSWALLQYGQAVSRTTYSALAALAAAASYPHGSGDGSTTFNIADKRGRVSAGKDDMGGTAANRITAAISGTAGTVLGAAVGGEGVTLATAQIPSHSHGGATGTISSDHAHGGNSGGRSAAHVHGDYGHNHIAVNGINFGDGILGDGDWAFNCGGGAPFGFYGNKFRTEYSYASLGGENYDHSHYLTTGGSSNGHAHAIDAVGGGGAHLNTQPTIIVNKIVRAL